MMRKGVCVKLLSSGEISEVKVDYGNGQVFDVEAAFYVKEGISPDCQSLPECGVSKTEFDTDS